MNVRTTPSAAAPGPRTPAGKAVAARNATSHGLFARDIVLPHLGEDPGAYNELYLEFCDQLRPQNLLERHYVEKIAAASWRLRRLHRWQAQVYEDPALSEDERIAKLEKVLRQETTLHRQIDQTVRLLNRDVPQLFARRARAQALAELDATETDCKLEPTLAADVERRACAESHAAGLAPGFDSTRLDTQEAPPADHAHPAPPAPNRPDTQNCENEPPPEPHDRDRDVSYIHPDGRPAYLQPDTHRALQRLRAAGEHERADEFEAHYRSRHLAGQQNRRPGGDPSSAIQPAQADSPADSPQPRTSVREDSARELPQSVPGSSH